MLSHSTSRNTSPRVGRPKTGGEIAEVRKPILFKPSEWEEIESSMEAGTKFATFVHDLVLNVARGKIPANPLEIDPALVGTDQLRRPVLSKAPCGPLKEALDTDDDFVISRETADWLEARESDFWIQAEGDSMEGAGIFEGDLLLMRPLDGRRPRRGEVALVQFSDEEGNIYEGTIKYWQGDSPLRLTNGAGEDVELPEGRDGVAAAVCRGVISRR